MADEFLEIGGKKIYKSLFKDPEGYERLKAAQSSTQTSEEWQQKQAAQEAEDTARLQKAGIELGPKPEEKPAPTQPQVSEQDKALQQEEAITAQAQQAAQPSPMAQTPAMVPAIPTTPQMVQDVTVSKIMQSPEGKAAMDSYKKAADASIKANEEKAGFEIERSNALALGREQLAQQNQADFAQLKKQQDEYQSRLSEQMAKMTTTADELKNYKFKDFFDGREGARVMAGISMALGAVGASITKGPNYAMEIIQSAIQNDLAMQKANYEKLKGTLEAGQTLYGQMRQKGLDDLQTTQSFIKVRNEQAIQQMEAAASKITDPEAKARVAAMSAQLRQDSAKALMTATEGLKTSVQTQIRQAAGQTPKDLMEARTSFEKKWKEGDNEIGQAIRAQNAAEKFRAAVKAGAGEEALVDFVASKGGLGQGSVGPSFFTLLNKQGLVDEAGNIIRTAFKGGVNPQTLNKIQNFLDAAAVQTAQDASGRLPQFYEEAQLVRLSPRDIEALTRQINEKGLKLSQIEKAGARRLSP